MIMLKSYFKLGFRSLRKNRLSSTINLLGLALAVGCCMVVFEFYEWRMHMDNFHRKTDHLFVIEGVAEKDGKQQLYGNSPAPLGPLLKSDFLQIKSVTRVADKAVVIKEGDNVFRENVSFVDPSMYTNFDFPVKWGDRQHFTDEDGIVLTEDLAQKIYGKQNPVGKALSIRFNIDGQDRPVNLTIKGVMAKQPIESSWHFSSLVPFSKMASLGMDKPGNWGESVDITFVEAPDEASLLPIQHQSKKYLELYNVANPNAQIAAFQFQPLRTMNLHAYKVKDGRFAATNPVGFIMLFAIAIATLLLVYFNYMNIAIASAATRLKEIGMRKVMGSDRIQIIVQFIIENMILCTFAVAVGMLLAKVIFMPWFYEIGNIRFGEGLFTNYRTWVALFALVVISAISGAAYPSFYISAFKPVNIIKGNSKMGSRNRFRKALLGFQFFLTFLAISIAIAFMQEAKEIRVRPWGYQPADNVVVTLDKSANYDAFKDELKNVGAVKSVTGSAEALGNYSKQLAIKADGKDEIVQSISTLPGFATQMGISITKGRDLGAQFNTDAENAVLVNRAFLKQMHWETGIGKNISYQHKLYQIVGEVNNFHFENFVAAVGPMVIMGCRPADVNFVYVKMSPGLFSNAHADVEKIWKRVNPNLPFEYYYQDGVFDDYFNGFNQVSRIMGAASLIMIVISISGIFGLALLILGKKMKEISVRKVLGAGIGNIVLLINKEFLFAIGFALLLGMPVSWWLTRNLFNVIAPGSAVLIMPLVLTMLILVVMTAGSVSWHIFKANIANPTKYLKDE